MGWAHCLYKPRRIRQKFPIWLLKHLLICCLVYTDVCHARLVFCFCFVFWSLVPVRLTSGFTFGFFYFCQVKNYHKFDVAITPDLLYSQLPFPSVTTSVLVSASCLLVCPYSVWCCKGLLLIWIRSWIQTLNHL